MVSTHYLVCLGGVAGGIPGLPVVVAQVCDLRLDEALLQEHRHPVLVAEPLRVV